MTDKETQTNEYCKNIFEEGCKLAGDTAVDTIPAIMKASDGELRTLLAWVYVKSFMTSDNLEELTKTIVVDKLHRMTEKKSSLEDGASELEERRKKLERLFNDSCKDIQEIKNA